MNLDEARDELSHYQPPMEAPSAEAADLVLAEQAFEMKSRAQMQDAELREAEIDRKWREFEVKEAAGHANVATTDIYLHLVERDDLPDVFAISP